MLQTRKIYLDVCCLNRPFDDQSDERIHLEAEAVFHILKLCSENLLELYASEITDCELEKITDLDKKNKIYLFMQNTAVKIKGEKKYTTEQEYSKPGIM